MQNDVFIDTDGNFVFSGKPSNIYKYKCFDDRSNDNWIDGQEYIDNPDWSQDRKDRWNFFYRPYNYGDNIGRYQKKEIKKVKPIIENLNKEYQLVKIKKFLSFIIFIFLVIFILFSENFDTWILLFIPSLMYFIYFLDEKELLSKINFEKEKIHKWELEIDFLLDQHQSILSSRAKPEKIQYIFWNDLRELEREVYKDYFFTELNQVKSDLPSFYSKVNKDIKDQHASNDLPIHPAFPVIPTWGLLQPVKSEGNEYRVTGVRAAGEDIAEKIATFRNLHDGRPFYRLWYIQYIFLTKKNFSVISFCYDFITREKYNVVGDTHQLNHITSSSSGDEDIVHFLDSRFIQSLNLPDNLIRSIYLSQVKNLKFSMSSGMSYSCFIPSEKVIKGLSKWSEQNNDKFPLLELEDESHPLHDKAPVTIFKNNYVLEILADRVADALRKYIDNSRPLTAEEHQKNRLDI